MRVRLTVVPRWFVVQHTITVTGKGLTWRATRPSLLLRVPDLFS
jgi:hypothetical protein